MTRDEIIAKLRETASALRAKGVTRLAFLGRAPAAMRNESDLDVLIEVHTGFPGKCASHLSRGFACSSFLPMHDLPPLKAFAERNIREEGE
jgi:hypothetical protein